MNSLESIVQNQLDAYNARDIEAILRIYADDAELYEHPATLVARGSDALRERFSERFKEPNLKARLLSRIVIADKVIDHEEVTRTFPASTGKLELLMIYEVKDGRISKAWLIVGARTLDMK